MLFSSDTAILGSFSDLSGWVYPLRNSVVLLTCIPGQYDKTDASVRVGCEGKAAVASTERGCSVDVVQVTPLPLHPPRPRPIKQ